MARKAEVIITCDATTVKQVLEGINREIAHTNQERQKLLDIQKKNGSLTEDEKKQLRDLDKYLTALNDKEQKATKTMKMYGEVMKDLSGAKLKDLKKALQEGKNALNNMSAKDPNRAKLVNDLKKIQNQIEANTGAIKKQQSAWGSLGTTLKNLVAYAGIFSMFNKINALMGEMLKKNKEFSDQLANVRKVSNLAMDDIDELANSLSKIDSRTSLKGLMELSYTGAKLGFGNYGIEGLESFAKSAVKVQNALSEDMGADAMTALSKMVEVMGLIPKMGVERAMDATGSAIFKLASTSTATGTNIVEFSKRLMGLANIAHITTPELLAIGSAADSMALMPEVAATAFNKLITAMQKQPNLIENALKIDKGTISDLYQAGKMTDAMVLVFEKMREKGGMNALMQSGVFKDLGSDGARLVAVMATMANRVDMLNAHLAVSRQAFEEGTAVAQEYAIQMDTAAAYSERAANIWEKAFVNPEGVDIVKELSKAWYEVSKSLTENEKIMFGVKLSLQGIILLLKTLLQLLPEIIFTLGIAGMASMWAKMREGEGVLASLTAWFGKLNTAQKAFFKAAGWVGLAITIFEVGKAVYDLAQKTKEAAVYMKGFKTDLSELNSEFSKAEMELNRYKKAIDEANMGTKQRAAAITNFNSKFGMYLKNLLTEKSTVDEVYKAYNRVLQVMRAKMALQLKEKDIEQQVMPREQWAAQRREEYNKTVKGTSRSQYNGNWLYGYLQDAKANKMNWRQIAEDLNKNVFNVTQSSFNEVMKQLNSDTFNELVTRTVKMGSGKKTVQDIMGPNAKQLWAAMRYVLQDLSAGTALNRVNEKWKPEQDAMDAYLASQQQEEPISPLEPLPDKGDKGGTSDKDKKLKDDFDKTKKQVEGLIAKIDEWYNLQEAAVKDAEATGEMTKKEADDLVQAMEIARNDSLMRARKAVGSGEQQAIDDWKKWAKTVLPSMLADSSEWSKNLMTNIQEVDAKALHDFLATLKEQTNDPKVMAMLDASSFFDTMMKKSAESKKKAEVLRAKFKETLDRYVKQYDVIIRAQDKMRDDLQSLGIMTETPEQMAARLANGEAAPDDRQQYAQMGGKFIGMNTIPYTIDITNKDDALYFIEQLTHDADGAMEQWAQAFPKLMEWVNLYQKNAVEGEHLGDAEKKAIEEAMPQIQALYYQLMNFSDGVSANIKKQVDQMTSRNPIGIDEMKSQHEQRVSLTTSLYDQKINEANDNGDVAQAVELEERKKQALIDLEYQFQQEMYQIREQMGTTWYEQYEKEVAMYKNMLDKKLISEREFQKKKKELDINLGLKNAQYFNGLMSNMVNALQEAEIASVEAKYDAEINAAKAAGQDTTALEEQKEAEIYEIRKKYAGMQLAVKISEIIANTAVAIMMAYAQLGPIAGSVAAAMLGVTGAAQLALAIAEYNKVMSASAGGSSKASSTGNATKTKLVSGMLTYDSGNVQRFIGQDGKVYTATEEPAPRDGLITHPIATTVQGQPALVAEKGPEIVIGRETTKAIMMNEPELIRYLANYQQQGGRRLYDGGNAESVVGGSVADTGATAERQALINRLDRSDALMEQVLYFLQNPVAPEIAMYDTGGKKGLHSKMQEANKFMARYGG